MSFAFQIDCIFVKKNTMKKIALLLLILGAGIKGYTQVNPDSIEIIRGPYGVPHIYAATDVEVAYGFAWAQA